MLSQTLLYTAQYNFEQEKNSSFCLHQTITNKGLWKGFRKLYREKDVTEVIELTELWFLFFTNDIICLIHDVR